jgi:hypothetical protein
VGGIFPEIIMTETLFDEPPLSGVTTQERQWAIFAHLSALISIWVGWIGCFLGPLIVWQIKKNEMPYVDQQGREALNFQLNMLGWIVVLAIVSVPVALVTFGLALVILVPLWAALGIYHIVMPIVAAVSCNSGEAYRYPYVIRIVK